MIFKYAQINELGYCIGISILSGGVTSDDMIRLDENSDEYLYINRKYDIEKSQWTDEYYISKEQIEKSHEEITKTISQDQLMSMEMELDTNSKIALTQADGLMIMEMLLEIQAMLTTHT
ncbi:MAG: hypothetical protein ACRDDX_10595 [Cellulosilyticaceae bacterium]